MMTSCPGPAAPSRTGLSHSFHKLPKRVTSASPERASTAARISGARLAYFSLFHHDKEHRRVELRVGVEFHVVIETLQRVAPIRHNAVDLVLLHGGHHVVD